MEPANGGDEDVQDQVLRRGDMNLAWAGSAEELAHLPRPVEKGAGVRQKRLPLVGERRSQPAAAALVVKLDAQSLLQGEEPIAQPLFRDVRLARRGPQAAAVGELDEGGDLVGRDRGEVVWHLSLKQQAV